MQTLRRFLEPPFIFILLYCASKEPDFLVILKAVLSNTSLRLSEALSKFCFGHWLLFQSSSEEYIFGGFSFCLMIHWPVNNSSIKTHLTKQARVMRVKENTINFHTNSGQNLSIIFFFYFADRSSWVSFFTFYSEVDVSAHLSPITGIHSLFAAHHTSVSAPTFTHQSHLKSFCLIFSTSAQALWCANWISA